MGATPTLLKNKVLADIVELFVARQPVPKPLVSPPVERECHAVPLGATARLAAKVAGVPAHPIVARHLATVEV